MIPCQNVEVIFWSSESRWRGKKRKNPKESKENKKNRTRKFSVKWQLGWPWLQHDQDGGGDGGGSNFRASEN